MVNFAADQGISLDYKTAKETHHQFWNVLFPGVRMLGERLEHQFEKQGYLYNEFGYRMVPERPQLALNYTTQSSVSGIMKLLDGFVANRAPWATWVTCIHDEMILTYPTERREETRLALQQATKDLNDYLQWSVNIRTGWAVGSNLFEAK
jgi:DNA polymerase I-like protein with 3'-5' exonuclease and polymerase domains